MCQSQLDTEVTVFGTEFSPLPFDTLTDDPKLDLPEVKLSMDQHHYFEAELLDPGPVTHARLSIYPDGGVSRLRLFGRVVPAGDAG